MEGETVSRVIASLHPDVAVGDHVAAYLGWVSHASSDGTGLVKLDERFAPPSTALGVLGMPGLTAYAGLLEIGKPKEGETVVVAAGAGPVGSLVGQIAKNQGCRVVGIAGGAEKYAQFVYELGLDDAIAHSPPPFADVF